MAAPSDATTLKPITIKKLFNRETFPGRAGIDAVQHVALEQGRMMDRSVGDAMYAIQEAKKQLLQRIENYLNLNKVATTAKLPDSARPVKLVKDILDLIKKVKELLEEVQDLIKGLLGVIGYLISLKARIQAFLQARLNSIATLINQICNFNLPDLPAIPNIFGGLYFDGFQFPHGAFKFALSFDANFAFGNCKLRKPNLDMLRNYPSAGVGLGKGGVFSNQPTLNPPLPNALIAKAGETREDLLAKTVPVLIPDFLPYGNFLGGLPKAEAIVSTYTLPRQILKDQIVSLLGGPLADMNPPGTVFATGGSSSATQSPAGLDVTLDVEYYRERLQPEVRSFSIQKINLAAIVDSGWDWKVVWAWLTYMHDCREARKGSWLPAFQEIYSTWVQAGYEDIQGRDVLWHTDLDNSQLSTPDPAAVFAGPADPLAFSKRVAALAEGERQTLLWKLSYLEASLLDYTRCTRWDSGKVGGFVDGPTLADLDYLTWAGTSAGTTTSILLDSGGRANYPSKLTLPVDLSRTMHEVVARALTDILSARTFTAEHQQARYVYTPRAETVEIDMHSQFWKEFVFRWEDLRQGDPLVYSVVCNYPDLLNSAVNPLASEADYLEACKDIHSRDWQWVRGTPYLPTPYLPTMLLPPMNLRLAPEASNGWGGVCPADHNTDVDPPTGTSNVDALGRPVPLMFSAEAFAARDDIQALSPNARDTLIYLNQAYADALAIGSKHIAAIDVQIATAQASIDEAKAFAQAVSAANFVSPDGVGGILSPGAFGIPTDDPTTQGGSTPSTPTNTSEDAVYVSPADAISDIAAMATGGVFSVAEKPRLNQDMARLDTERQATLLLANAALPSRPELQALIANVNAGWSGVIAWMYALSPAYTDTTVATALPSGGPQTLTGLLTSYYGAFLVLETALTSQGSSTATAKTYEHTQTVPDTVWVVDHNFHRYPDVTVLDDTGAEMLAEVQNITVDRLEVRVGSPMAGKVLCQ